jgi:hypothetical protein
MRTTPIWEPRDLQFLKACHISAFDEAGEHAEAFADYHQARLAFARRERRKANRLRALAWSSMALGTAAFWSAVGLTIHYWISRF